MTGIRRGLVAATFVVASVAGTAGIGATAANAAPAAASVTATAPTVAVDAKSKKDKKKSKTKLDKRCLEGRVICVDKTTRKVRWVVDGERQFTMSARFGASGTPTHSGSYTIYWKDADHVSSLFGSAMPLALFFNGGQAVHYSSDFAARGYNGASHGCVNTRDWSKMKKLFKKAKVGDRVVIYRS